MLLMFASAASAEWSIGVNFLGGKPGTPINELAVQGTAGLPGFAQNNWNNVAPWTAAEGRAIGLVDSAARPTKTDVSWKAPAVDSLDEPLDSPDGRLMNGSLLATQEGDIEVTIDDIPFASYDVLLYYGGDQINLSALRGRIGAHLDALPFAGSYVSTTAAADQAANVLGPIWLSGSRSITVYASVRYGGTSAALAAIQLVAHPGDTDGDHDVDSSDFADLILGWTGPQPEPALTTDDLPTPLWSKGDFDGDYDVDSSDLVNLILHWTGSPSSPASALPAPAAVPVPEPHAWVTAALGAIALMRRRRARSAKDASHRAG